MGSIALRGYLLDTHIWFWYLIGSQRLPKGLVGLIDGAQDNCWFSPISVWELSMLSARGRIEISGNFRPWILKALELFPIREASFKTEVAIVSQEIELPHGDPADHFIVATAKVYELTLLTVDQRLLGLDWLSSRSS